MSELIPRLKLWNQGDAGPNSNCAAVVLPMLLNIYVTQPSYLANGENTRSLEGWKTALQAVEPSGRNRAEDTVSRDNY